MFALFDAHPVLCILAVGLAGGAFGFLAAKFFYKVWPRPSIDWARRLPLAHVGEDLPVVGLPPGGRITFATRAESIRWLERYLEQQRTDTAEAKLREILDMVGHYDRKVPPEEWDRFLKREP